MKYFIGLDIGTSAVKGALMTEEGKLIETSTGKYTYFGDDFLRMMDPQEFVDVCCSVIKELALLVKGEDEVAAICSCHASGNTIWLDENNKPLSPIYGWQTRIADEDFEEAYTQEEKDIMYKLVGWGVGNSMTCSQFPYVRKYEKEIFQNSKTVTMSNEYLNFILTGKWGLSHSMATPGYLMDQEKGEYSEFILNKFGIADKFLPPIYDKGTVLGEVLPEIAEKLCLSENTKVVLGSFDHPSGALGAGVFEVGEMLLSCGTSWVELFPVATRDIAISTGGLVDRFMLDGPPYCVMLALSSVSEIINERRERYLGKRSHTEFDDLVKESYLGCDGLVIDFSDKDDENVKGYSKPHIARAIIEAAARMLKDNLKEAKEKGLDVNKITIIGGISNSSICTNVISEVLELPMESINTQVAGAVGACLLGGIGVGVFDSEKDAFSKHYEVK